MSAAVGGTVAATSACVAEGELGACRYCGYYGSGNLAEGIRESGSFSKYRRSSHGSTAFSEHQ